MSVYDNLEKLELTLPSPSKPGGVYVPVKQVGNLLYVSGQIPLQDGKPVAVGKLGNEVTIEEGQAAARVCILNTLAVVEHYLGDLNKVKNVIKLLGFVASAAGFNDQPKVINAGSQLLVDVFGEGGQHARSAVSTNELPGNVPVEIETIFEVE